MATNISVTATKPYTPNTDALQVLINKQVYTNFQGFQFQRSMEQVPSTFQMELLCDGSNFPSILSNEPVQIYLKKKMIFSGMVEMKNIAISGNNAHSLVISGRGGLKKLVDGNPIYPGTSINNIQSLEDLCHEICGLYGIGVINKSQAQDKSAWNSVPYNIGDTGWSILDRYARYQGKLLYDNGYSALVIADVATQATTVLNERSPLTSYSYNEDITQRYANYEVIWQPFTTQSQTGLPPVFSATDPQAGIFANENRTLVTINSTSDQDGTLAQRFANWQANRNYGRSRSVSVTLQGFTDAGGQLWDVNQMAAINLPMINVVSDYMVTATVSYSYNAQSGSSTTMTLYPKEAFSFEPTTLYQSNPALQSLPSS
ncbi:phage baseplate assembly protein [Komagataeibacter medellinensis]|nr:hypothetical protein [Komagataeibacter medellinensis]